MDEDLSVRKVKFRNDPLLGLVDPFAVSEERFQLFGLDDHVQDLHQFIVFSLLNSKGLQDFVFLLLVCLASVIEFLGGLNVLEFKFMELLLDGVDFLVEVFIVLLDV